VTTSGVGTVAATLRIASQLLTIVVRQMGPKPRALAGGWVCRAEEACRERSGAT
jgi:hypothetical protein